MLPTNLRSILAVIAVAVTVSANPYPKLIGCVDVVDIKTGKVADCVPVGQLPNGQDSNHTKHQGKHARRRAKANENNLCVNLKFNTQSPSTTTGPDQNRCVSFSTLRQLQTDYQYQHSLKPRGDEGDNVASNEPCLDVYYLSPKDNTTMTGSCVPISDLEKYETVTINPIDPPSDGSPNDPYGDLSSKRDFGPGVNYTFCTEPYDVIPHLQYESPHYLDCVMIPANALGRSRYFTYRTSNDAYTLLTAKTCELALRTTGTVVKKGEILKIGNTDIERSYLHGVKAINDLPANAGGKQQLWYAQGFEVEGKWKCWDNAETQQYQVYFGYKLKGSKPAWWEGMGNR
ncbi:hypothetical protein B0H65DRAFT_588438 [Neurospora tetraspora]|uniref:Ecp2 effector protein-like domain-containing protein n=1 Tax=Neurospora tetraspora TaxID=94610 RepID=A0AAE0JE30_9PEZI|nr:hypothetical protein B0H65DRAFT_588438 [Neurospora tetraspora]